MGMYARTTLIRLNGTIASSTMAAPMIEDTTCSGILSRRVGDARMARHEDRLGAVVAITVMTAVATFAHPIATYASGPTGRATTSAGMMEEDAVEAIGGRALPCATLGVCVHDATRTSRLSALVAASASLRVMNAT